MTDAFPDISRVDIIWMQAPVRIASAEHWATLRVYPVTGALFARDTFADRTGEVFMIELMRSDAAVILRSAEVADSGTYADLIIGAMPAEPVFPGGR